MKNNSLKALKSTFFVFLPVLICSFALYAQDLKDQALKAGFDNDFRFYNEFGLKGKIAFTTKISDLHRILVIDLDNRRVSKIIDSPGNNSYSSWSPKGDKIAFTSDRDGNKEIYTANSDGSQQQRITNNQLSDDNASWSKDGLNIAYYSGTDSGKNIETNIFLHNIQSGKKTQLTSYKDKNSTPDFSWDNKLIAYTTSRSWPGWDICIFDIEKGKDTCPLSGTVTYCRPSFSPDNKYLAYSSGLFSSVDGYIYDIEKDESKKIAGDDGNEYDLKWDKSGEYIVYASDKETKNIYSIYATRIKDGKTSLLLSSPYSLRYLSWHQ